LTGKAQPIDLQLQQALSGTPIHLDTGNYVALRNAQVDARSFTSGWFAFSRLDHLYQEVFSSSVLGHKSHYG
jgi:hypothetical protein